MSGFPSPLTSVMATVSLAPASIIWRSNKISLGRLAAHPIHAIAPAAMQSVAFRCGCIPDTYIYFDCGGIASDSKRAPPTVAGLLVSKRLGLALGNRAHLQNRGA